MKERQRDREIDRQTDRQRHRQRQRKRDRDRQKQIETERERQRQTETDRQTKTERQTDRACMCALVPGESRWCGSLHRPHHPGQQGRRPECSCCVPRLIPTESPNVNVQLQLGLAVLTTLTDTSLVESPRVRFILNEK